MLEVTNPLLKRLILEHIIEQIDGGGITELLQAGFSAEFLDELRGRSARDLIRLSEFDALAFRVSLPEPLVGQFLARVDVSRHSAERCEYFVRHGASVRMVCDLFRMSAADVRTLRGQLLDPEMRAGRQGMPCDEVRDRIHERWHELIRVQPDIPLRERIYRLHQSFPDLSIDALSRTLNEFTNAEAFPATDFGELH